MGTSVPIFLPPVVVNMTNYAPVAVIIPTFNRAELLPRALESVFSQSLPAAEVCVVDDGSDDATRQIVREQFPDAQYHYQDNQGVSAARNLGVASSDAPWLAFLDSDDAWHPDKLEVQCEHAIENEDASLIHCDEVWIRNGRRVNPMQKHQKQGGDIFDQSLGLCAISPSAVMLKRTLFEAVGGFDEGLPACEDYDLWLRICSQHDVEYIEEALLTRYAGHEDQLSQKYWGMDRFRVRSLRKLILRYPLNASQRSKALQTLKHKCRVLIGGAQKRNNGDLIAECEAILLDCGVVDLVD